MATGFDELIEFLLSEIALCGIQGMSILVSRVAYHHIMFDIALH